jgi:hypothetical protein
VRDAKRRSRVPERTHKARTIRKIEFSRPADGILEDSVAASQKVAGVECRWHDMRHTAVSRVAAGGATDGTLQARWLSPEMIERYSHVSSSAKRRRFPC